MSLAMFGRKKTKKKNGNKKPAAKKKKSVTAAPPTTAESAAKGEFDSEASAYFKLPPVTEPKKFPETTAKAENTNIPEAETLAEETRDTAVKPRESVKEISFTRAIDRESEE